MLRISIYCYFDVDRFSVPQTELYQISDTRRPSLFIGNYRLAYNGDSDVPRAAYLTKMT
jgi:hypothetical protein